MSLIHSSLFVDSLLVGSTAEWWGGGSPLISTCIKLVVAHSTLEATSVFLPLFLDLARDSFSLTVLLWSVLLLWSSSWLYPILKGMLLAPVLAVFLARVLVSALELDADDIHAHTLFSPLIGIFAQVFVACHAAAEGTCELVDDGIDYCRVWYFCIGVQSINLIEVVLDWSSLPEFVYLQGCPIGAVMVSVV